MSAEYVRQSESLAEAAAASVAAVISSQPNPFGATITVFSEDNAWEAVIEIKIQENRQNP